MEVRKIIVWGLLVAMAGFLGSCASKAPKTTSTKAAPAIYPDPNPQGEMQIDGEANMMSSVGDCPSMGPDKLQGSFMKAINKLRSSGGECLGDNMSEAPALQWSPELAQVANKYAEEMAILDKLSPIGADGSELYQRLAVAGWSGGEAGENLNHGARSVDKALQSWALGGEYCRNMYNPRFTKVGAGYMGCYWYVIFSE